ncbi:MAG: hypothetical protein JO025_23575 [Verrucomicrobia bacterium]|nr:hypothetical protein [Verrucomicrobiota bacterium]
MPPADLFEQLSGLRNLLVTTSTPNFDKLSGKQQLADVVSSHPFEKSRKLSRDDVRSVFRKYYADISQALSAAELGVSIATTSYAGGMCLAGLLTPYTGIGWPVALTACPMFALGTIFATNDVLSFIGNQKRNETSAEFDAIQALQALDGSDANTFLQLPDFSIDRDLPGFHLQIDEENFPGLKDTVPPGTPSKAEEDLKNYVAENAPSDGHFNSQTKLQDFAEEYIKRATAVQTEVLKSYLDAERDRNASAAAEARDKSAFYQALHNIVGNLLSRSLPPQEAQILDALIGAGFSYLIEGSMGPLGWGAIALNLVNALLQSGDSVQQQILTAINQISKQLAQITRQIEEIYHVEVTILNRIAEVFDQVVELKQIAVAGLENLALQSSRIYQAITSDAMQAYYTGMQTNTLVLKGFLTKDRPTQEQAHAALRALRDLTLQVGNRPFTAFERRGFGANEIYDLISNSGVYDHQISLYNVIGLATALASYDPTKDMGACTRSLVHPKEFYIACNNIVDWCVISDASDSLAGDVLQSLLDLAIETRSTMNECCSTDIVKAKSSQYSALFDRGVEAIYEFLRDREEIDFANRGGVWAAIFLSSSRDFEDNVDYGKLFKAVGMSNDVPQIVDPLKNSNDYAQHPTIADRFNDVRNDDPALTVLIDLGFCSEPTQDIETWWKRRAIPGTNVAPGQVLAKKTVHVTVDHLPLSEKENIKLSAFSFSYEKTLILDGSAWLAPTVSAVTRAHYELTFTKNFKEAIAEACKAQTNHDIKDFVADWDAFDPVTGSMHLLSYILGEYLAFTRREYLQAACRDERFFGQPLQGTGLAFLYLSHMNQIVTADEFMFDGFDLTGSLCSLTDIRSLVGQITDRDFQNEPVAFQSQLGKLATQVQIMYRGNAVALDLKRWRDYVCVLLLDRKNSVVQSFLDHVAEVKKSDADPYIADSCNRLKWCLRLLKIKREDI